MSYKIQLENKAAKFLKELKKGQPKEALRLTRFLETKLQIADNPCELPNAKQLKGFNDNHNRWRWRLGDYRVIGIVQDGEFKVIQIIKIAKRDESTYRGL